MQVGDGRGPGVPPARDLIFGEGGEATLKKAPRCRHLLLVYEQPSFQLASHEASQSANPGSVVVRHPV